MVELHSFLHLLQPQEDQLQQRPGKRQGAGAQRGSEDEDLASWWDWHCHSQS